MPQHSPKEVSQSGPNQSWFANTPTSAGRQAGRQAGRRAGRQAHLPDGEQALNHVLAALVDGSLVQDGPEALKHTVQPSRGNVLQVRTNLHTTTTTTTTTAATQDLLVNLVF
jgi:hypothetical protein